MSYIYKSNGQIIKTNDIIEHMDICFGSLCITNERNIPPENISKIKDYIKNVGESNFEYMTYLINAPTIFVTSTDKDTITKTPFLISITITNQEENTINVISNVENDSGKDMAAPFANFYENNVVQILNSSNSQFNGFWKIKNKLSNKSINLFSPGLKNLLPDKDNTSSSVYLYPSAVPISTCPNQNLPTECTVCQSCDSKQCNIPKPCPVCADIDDKPQKISGKISEPYIITQLIYVNNSLNILQSYVNKLKQYNVNAAKKYILHQQIDDISLFLDANSKLNVEYSYNSNLASQFEDLAEYDKVQKIKELLNENKIKEFPNFTKIISAFSFKVSFKPPIIETFTNLSKQKSYYSIQGNFISNFIETFDNRFDINGEFLIYLIDVEIDNQNSYRYLILTLDDDIRNTLNNALLYNIPFEVSQKYGNIAPNTYQEKEVEIFGKNFLQSLFTKPDPDNYIYYENEDKKIITEIIKKNIDQVKYNKTETDIFINEINQSENKFANTENNDVYQTDTHDDIFKDAIKTHNFGNILFINKVFKFELNIDSSNYVFFIYDLKLSDYKIYRFLYI